MRVAVFSDIHGNLIALERFVKATRLSVDSYVCLGDVVDYGPWNDECVELVLQLQGIVLLEGNHERLFLGADDVSSERPLVRAFYDYSYAFFTHFERIANLPKLAKIGNFQCEHTLEGRTIYPDTPVTIRENRFVGHSHHQFQRVVSVGWRLINTGSVGQNRRWIDMVDYAVLDTETDHVDLFSLHYDVDPFIAELRARHYSESCIQYYMSKPRKYN